MKKLNILVLAICLSTQLIAQDKKTESSGSSSAVLSRMGAYGGVNFANIGGDQDSYDKSLTGWQLGLMFCMYSSGNLALWAEPGYTSIGSKYSDTYVDGGVHLGYIQLPIIARFQSQSGLFGDIGLQPQLLVSAKDKFNGGSEDFKDAVNGFDFGIPIGVGYEYKKKVGLGARYYWGLTNIAKDSGGDNAFNRVFSIRLHYRF